MKDKLNKNLQNQLNSGFITEKDYLISTIKTLEKLIL